jgi:phosphonate transport system ATP-binding protein
MSQAVKVQGLVKDFPDGHRALHGVDLTVEPGQLVALVGSNGAGKSTMLRCLVRLQEPTEGQITINSKDVTAIPRRKLTEIRRDVGFIFQHFNLVERVSAFRNVINGAIARRGMSCILPATAPKDVRREAMESLDRVGLADMAQQRVDTLSGGQRQRVAIARSLMQRPQLLLADEPVASLDPEAGRAVMELLEEIAIERGITVITALHQIDFALDYTHRIIGLRNGRVELDESTTDLSSTDLAGFYRSEDPQTLKAAL